MNRIAHYETKSKTLLNNLDSAKLIPVKADKTPGVEGWNMHGIIGYSYHDARSYADLLDKKPEYQLGYLTGYVNRNIFVIDIDQEDVFQDFYKQWKDKTYIVKTARGGHFYFRYNKSLKSKIGKITSLNGIEVPEGSVDLKGEGGYVLAEGSVVKNHVYECVSNNHPRFLSQKEFTQMFQPEEIEFCDARRIGRIAKKAYLYNEYSYEPKSKKEGLDAKLKHHNDVKIICSLYHSPAREFFQDGENLIKFFRKLNPNKSRVTEKMVNGEFYPAKERLRSIWKSVDKYGDKLSKSRLETKAELEKVHDRLCSWNYFDINLQNTIIAIINETSRLNSYHFDLSVREIAVHNKSGKSSSHETLKVLQEIGIIVKDEKPRRLTDSQGYYLANMEKLDEIEKSLESTNGLYIDKGKGLIKTERYTDATNGSEEKTTLCVPASIALDLNPELDDIFDRGGLGRRAKLVTLYYLQNESVDSGDIASVCGVTKGYINQIIRKLVDFKVLIPTENGYRVNNTAEAAEFVKKEKGITGSLGFRRVLMFENERMRRQAKLAIWKMHRANEMVKLRSMGVAIDSYRQIREAFESLNASRLW